MRNTTVILFLFSLHVVAAADDEGTALLDFKLSFQDVDNALSNWVDTLNYCNWRGVTCNNVTFHVFALNLSGFNLGGQISPSIGYLKGLTDIDLSENHISGQIPYQIGDCLALNFLVLTDNLLTGPIPSTLSQIPNLQVLDLSYNMLSGDIPSLIYWNEGLQYLGLRENNLTGSLSPDMCHLTGLWYFDVRNNSLTGNIPLNIGNCTFRLLDLSYNQLTGEIPFNIGFLRVVTLLLQGNRFTGKIPSAIGRMQALSLLDLSCNFLTGPIPPILGNLTNAEKLFLHGNKLTGSIPPELGNMTMLHYLKLYDNRLSGHIPPELGKLTDLYELNVANNYLQGPIPENLSSCTNLNNLNLYNNKLNGTIPPAFQKLESMTHLNLSSNNIKGPIPIELSRIVNLDTLDLSNNQISGSIPSSVGELEHLLKLNLSKNRMTGYIPAEFGNLQSVMEIDLSYNQLSGQIPQGLGLLQNLLSLDFSYNQLSGQIPQGLGLLQNLLSLRVENNNLTGDLLSLVDSLSLSDLNVSYNNLAGNIPSGHKLSRFPPNSFIGNPGLCGSSINSACHNSHSTKRAPISIAAIPGIAFGSLVILLMILVAVCRRQNQPPFSEGTMDKPVHHISPKLVIFHKNMALHGYEDIMRMTENWSEKYIIGFGACSTVYKCILNNCRPVAIKRLHSQNPQSLEFETELETVGSIKHRNLVCLQGYSLSPSGNLLFYDYMENGSLWDLLHDPEKKQKLDWDTRLKIALGAAQGLAYLHHDCSPYIVHRDVKSSNILVDKDFEAHLTDFGIAKRLCTSNTSTYVMGTIGYIDPEYAQTSRLTVKSDVYSYGIVLLELLTGRQAVDDECNLHDLIMSKTTNNAVSNAVMETVDPDIFATCKDLRAVRRIFQLALLCNKRKASGRPTMHEVTRVLESLVPAVASRQGTPLESLVPTTEASYMDAYLSFNVNRT